MSKYTLTSEELALIEDLSHLRNDKKVAKGVRSYKIKREYGEREIHVIGLKGEVLMARLLGLPVDTSHSLKGDDGHDLTFPSGITVQVKCRTKRSYEFALTTPSLYNFKSDIGVLCISIGTSAEVYFVGWTTRLHFAKNCKVVNFGYGDRLVIPNNKLISPQLLLDRVDAFSTVYDASLEKLRT